MSALQATAAGARAIDWYRMAEPQPDQYDTEIALDFAERAGYVRRSFPDVPHIMGDTIAALDEGYIRFPSYCVPAPADHPNVSRACELLELWPDVARQFSALTETVALYRYEDVKREMYHSAGTERFGGIAATVDNPVELAESFVHEMAHHKLKALGVFLTAADRIFTNPQTDCFHSPIRYDCMRPMPAVFHAQYSFTHALTLHCRIASADTVTDWERTFSLRALSALLPKLEFGEAVLREFALLDSAGEEFLGGFWEWYERERQTGHRLIREAGISPEPFHHPLAGVRPHVTERPIHSVQAQTDPMHEAPPDRVIPRAYPGVHSYQVVGEMVLYSPDHERAYSLNSSARAIWELCDGERSAWSIAELLGAELAFPAEDLLPDVRMVLGQLGELGLLELRGVAGGPRVTAG